MTAEQVKNCAQEIINAACDHIQGLTEVETARVFRQIPILHLDRLVADKQRLETLYSDVKAIYRYDDEEE